MAAARRGRSHALPAALTACACAGLLASEAAGDAEASRALCKLLASAGFVWLAAASAAGAPAGSTGGGGGGDGKGCRAGLHPHARWLLAAALLSLVGDAALLGRGDAAFLAGLTAFMGAHVAYIAAFASAGARRVPTLAAAAVLAAPVEAARRWLWLGVPRAMRPPVAAYMAAVTLMLAAAAALAAQHATAAPAADAPPGARQAMLLRRRRAAWARLAGAALFLLSDVAVAADRFRGDHLHHKLLGLPAYYAGQLLLAGTAGAPV